MHGGAHFFQPLFMGNPKMLLFIDNNQREIFDRHAFAEQCMRAHHNIDRAIGQTFFGFGQLFGRHKARGLSDHKRQAFKAFGKILEMLAGQQSGGHNNRHLKTRNRHGKSSPQGDFGFTKADIATDQTIHRVTGSQII